LNQKLTQSWVRDTDLSATDHQNMPDRGVLKCKAKGVSANHSGRPNNDNVPLLHAGL
jgi:hypothetical protein